MKHATTHNMLLLGFAVAIIALCGVAAAAQETVPEPVETVTVSTHVARVSIAVPNMHAHDLVRWEVSDNGAHPTEFTVDAPDANNPLALTIVMDLGEARGNEWRYSMVGDQLERLASRLRLKRMPRVFVAGPSTTRFPFRWPKAWETSYAADVRSAFRDAINNVEHGEGVRRALLVLTNRFEALPSHIFEWADERLAHTAALVFILSVAPQSNVASGTRRVVAQGNLEMDANVSTSIEHYTPMFSFAQFVRTANALHVVSYNLGDGEFAHEQPSHLAEIKVISANGEILARQRRRYRLEQ